MKKLLPLLLLLLVGCTTSVTTFPDGKTIKTSSPAGLVASIVSGLTQGTAAAFSSHNEGFSK